MNIHHWFIANKRNKFHPVALRPVGLAVFAALFVTIPFLYNVTSAKNMQVLGYATNVTVADVHMLSNQERTNNGLTGLNLSGALNSAALAKANDMIAKNYWAHVAPDGTTPWAFISGSGYQYTVAGENLAKNFSFSGGVVAGWMGSATHRANILSSSYQDVGYAVVNGVLQGSETTLVVAMYATRYTAPPPVPAPAPTPTVAPTQVAPPVAQPANPAPVVETPVEAPVVIEEIKEPVVVLSEDQTKTSDSITQPVATKSVGVIEAVVAGVGDVAPVRAYATMNWGQKVSVLLICTLILLFVMKHTLIWREQKRGLRHIWLRSHPLGQAATLTAVLIITIFSSVGVVL